MPAPQTVTAVHMRSVVLVGAERVNCPCGHDALCVVHKRLDVDVGARLSNCKLWHWVTASHAEPSAVLEYVAPSSQAEHCRSVVAEPAFCIPNPGAHFVHCEHNSMPEVAANVPGVQIVHARSLLGEADTDV